MRIKQIKLYQFNELSEEAKEKAREWYRGLQNSDFSENVTDDAKEQLKLLGFEVDEIYWSGFWSQGDGACFTGTWSAKNVKGNCDSKKLNEIAAELQDIAKRFPEASATLKHSGMYYHEQSVAIECEEFTMERDDGPVWSSTDAANFQEAARECMRWIYKSLEDEYNWQNADEQVDENICANEYEFTEDGSIG